jgi:hypothetical protein
MRVEPVFKDKLEIGKFYLVPTVYGPLGFRMDYWPVLGPMHDDKEVIGFPLSHYHYDFRFFNSDQWAYVLRYTSGGVPHGAVMCHNPITRKQNQGLSLFGVASVRENTPNFHSREPKEVGCPNLEKSTKISL